MLLALHGDGIPSEPRALEPQLHACQANGATRSAPTIFSLSAVWEARPIYRVLRGWTPPHRVATAGRGNRSTPHRDHDLVDSRTERAPRRGLPRRLMLLGERAPCDHGTRPDRVPMLRSVDTVTGLLLEQLDFYLRTHLFPRLHGLQDDEYFWKPAPDCWSVVDGPGGWELEQAWPEPDPPPVTTIGWRLAHIAASNIGTRANAFFGHLHVPGAATFNDPGFAPAIPGSAEDAIGLPHEVWELWRDGLAGLGDGTLLAPIGPFGGWFADEPLAALVLHVSRETMHHGGEIGVLRDLYRARGLGPSSC